MAKQARHRRGARGAHPADPQSGGPATDRFNAPVIDPTENVLSLVEAAIQRQDDLRAMALTHVQQMTNLQVEHLKDIGRLRAEHSTEMRLAEAARIDAIRLIDVGAVNRAAEVAFQQAQTLATQVTTSAETLRTQVATVASAANTTLAAALEPIQKDVSELRQVQFQQQGERVAKADDRDTRVVERGQSNWLVGVAVSVGGLLLGIIAFIAAELARRGG